MQMKSSKRVADNTHTNTTRNTTYTGKENIFNRPNIVSFSRVPLLLIAVYLILTGFDPQISASIIILIFLLDLADGYIARKFGEETEFGKVADEMVDRIIENVLFIVFACLAYIPVWAPIIMIMRAIIVDTLTPQYKRKETAAYKRLIRSDLSRGGYGFLKMLLFAGLVFYPSLSADYQHAMLWLTVLVVFFSVFRGLAKLREIGR